MNAKTHKELLRYIEHFPSELEILSPLLRALDSDSFVLDRNTQPGHVTSSGIVLSGQLLLMVYHPFLRKVLPPGGHVEPGESPSEAALREVQEETGFICARHLWHQYRSFPIDIDIHSIPENSDKGEPEHQHYDFRYLLTIESEATIEKKARAWVDLGEIMESNLVRVISKLRKEGCVA